ncbi:cytochrome c-type biogenesis protein [Shewanella waksmanii]|uniref:cytochrome c-type biogenesis protein n=1 Tax=Shewanella waksmanii TaxID=213783 RepID=UPI0004B990E9|nr:cytochrome c-type biogenesis protein [Shewanella waksmanii]
MGKLHFVMLLATLMLLPLATQAVEPRNYYSEAEIKTLGFDIAKSLRCPMATNQTLFDSQNQIANELKAEIFIQLEQGRSKQQIIDFMVARYGEKIRYMPSLSAGTAPLYLIPISLVLLVIIAALFSRRLWRQSAPKQEQTDA